MLASRQIGTVGPPLTSKPRQPDENGPDLAALLFGLMANGAAHAAELAELKVLYVGSGTRLRIRRVLEGEGGDWSRRGAGSPSSPEDAARFDVVLFDWPQGEETREMRKLKSPLGTREGWNKPTVLLGSAGLNLAVCWKLKGGSGCTCLDPLAYDLREHEIFERPFRIDRGKMVSIPTPADFSDELKESEIKVLPLVADIHQKMESRLVHARPRIREAAGRRVLLRRRQQPDADLGRPSGGRGTCSTSGSSSRPPR